MVCTSLCRCASVCACKVWMKESGVLFCHTPCGYFEAEALKALGTLALLARLASQRALRLFLSLLKVLGLQICTALPSFVCGSWEFKLRSSYFHNKHSTHGSISPVPSLLKTKSCYVHTAGLKLVTLLFETPEG